MTEIVEIHWNARPYLTSLRIKVKGGSLDPRAERLFQQVREGAATLFPGCAILVRIATRDKDPNARLRISRDGVEQHDLEAMEALIERVAQQVALNASGN
ncbi:hypothetical protein KBI52_10395 [Microvirga sp. HBU67558]|uniref:hypothetical protein n=1 Tax=Microvirga sp. HBU67558 TaxID=2824562 RepID=UPI001B36DDBD|nr:hypothetical protein [Microvirga sp. HBU67558]MBQ0820613.1 hypothetical protein [Microvirga sp. HBU67558]